MKREFLQSFKVGEAALPKEIIDAIMAQNGQDIQAAKQGALDWEDKYNRAIADHNRQLSQLRLESMVESAVTKAGGRNLKAISALLDLQAIGESQDVRSSLDEALQQLKQENSYLFEGVLPPPYAKHTGEQTRPAAAFSLAGALRERMKG